MLIRASTSVRVEIPGGKVRIDLSRMKPEDYACFAAGFALLATVFLPWYTLNTYWLSGWDATRLSIVPMTVSIVALLIIVASALGIDFAEEYGFALLALGTGCLAVTLVRVFARPPGTVAQYGLYLAVVFSAIILFSGAAKLFRAYLMPPDQSM